MNRLTLVKGGGETVDAKMERLAAIIADEALGAEMVFANRLDALKTLTAWEMAKKKLRPDEAPRGLLDHMRDAINNAQDD